MSSNGERNIIRQLGNDECMYDHLVIQGNFILTRTLLTRIEESYVSRLTLDLLRKAAKLWKKIHPILNSTIKREFDIHKLEDRKIGSSKYFVYMDSLNESENVELESTSNSDYWKEVLENEADHKFDLINGPLWAIRVIRYADTNKLAFIFTTHHSIGDGKNLFTIFTQYVELVARLLKNEEEQIELTPIESNKFMEEMVYEYKLKENYRVLIEPNEFNENVNKLSFKLGNEKIENKARFDFFKLEKSQVDKLLAKMKKETKHAKLTSVLQTIFAICLRRLYEKYQVDDIDEIDALQAKILVSLREKLGLVNDQMGVYSLALNSRINTKGLDEENFWLEAEKRSMELHNRIKNNEDLEEIGPNMNLLIDLINSGFDFTKHTSHNFVLSNIGLINSNNMSVIKIDAHYIMMQMSYNCFAGPLFNGITTINGDLCWSLSFNQRYFSREKINELKESILAFVDHIVKSNDEIKS
jgi:hypothetical protein